MKPGDIIVAGENFGCGSSRRHAPVAIKASGIACVVARGFCPHILPQRHQHRALHCGVRRGRGRRRPADCGFFEQGRIENLTKGTGRGIFSAFPSFLQTLLESGGLLNAVREGKL